jgi:DNA-binding response OmpR family regulator
MRPYRLGSMDPRDRLRPSRILVIDDDRYIRMLLCDLLTNWGYQADVAADGVEGLALFDRGGYDAVLTDLRMPHVSGLDVAAGIRDRDPSVGVILFTAFHGEIESEEQRRGLTVLRKPLEIEGLRRALRETLTGAS